MNEQNIKKTYTTSDIALAAYLKLQGMKLIECGKQGNKFNFIFDDPEDKSENLSLAFVNSDMRKYDDEMRSLKKVIYNKK